MYPYILIVITRNKIAWVSNFLIYLRNKCSSFNIDYYHQHLLPKGREMSNYPSLLRYCVRSPSSSPYTKWVLLSCFCNCKEIAMPLVPRQHGNEIFIFISKFMGMKTFFATYMYILFTYYVWATFSISDVPHHYYPIIKPTLGDF